MSRHLSPKLLRGQRSQSTEEDPTYVACLCETHGYYYVPRGQDERCSRCLGQVLMNEISEPAQGSLF